MSICELDSGIEIEPGIGVIIKPHGKFWSMSLEEREIALAEVKNLIGCVDDVYQIRYWRTDGGGGGNLVNTDGTINKRAFRLQCSTYPEDNIGDYWERSKNNPFLHQDEKDFMDKMNEIWIQEQEIKIELGRKQIHKQEKKERAVIKRSPGFELKAAVIERDGLKCRYCGSEISPKNMRLDHIVPYGLGGFTEVSNLVVSCHKCNATKGMKTPEQAGMKLLPLEGK